MSTSLFLSLSLSPFLSLFLSLSLSLSLSDPLQSGGDSEMKKRYLLWSEGKPVTLMGPIMSSGATQVRLS